MVNTKFLKKILGDPQASTLKRMRRRVNEINGLADRYKKMSDSKLRAQTDEFKKRLASGESLDRVLPEAFAAVREAATRTLKQRHFDVQLIGGMVLHEGNVSEMKTGEGKTLVATLALYLNALEGKGAHLVTVNDYLAQRDAGWMGQIYDFLGLSVGVIIPDESYIYDSKYENKEHFDERMKHLRPATRQEAYQADITYGTNNEFGFDYLRDNMVREVDQLRQRDLHYAIVDEVDSILIDEARTPLIISAPSTASGAAYEQFAKVVRPLKESEHYEKDEKRRSVILTDSGVDYMEKALGVSNLYSTDNVRTIYHLEQALRAQVLFNRDKDYVVTNEGEIVIVDDFTGRLLRGRRYNEGLHQAIEAKEGVEVQQESMTLATISFQNYFRLYKKLAGMTGTAATESEEFHQIYKLNVVEVPPNRKLIREDRPDRIYKTEKGKMNAIAAEVKAMHEKGQPVLLGTVSIEKNEVLSASLKRAGVPHEVLNAKNNEREAMIVAKAGNPGAVTLATNIAGRGTDIVLGKGVTDLGGLFVLGTERHESRRIDNQLRGRSGRQGDPGATQFYVSCQDDLMRVYGGDKIASIMDRLKVDEGTPIESRMITKSLENAQKKVEGFNFDMRKNVVQYDDVMNRHRKAIYAMRREILISDDIKPRISKLIEEEARVLSEHPDSVSERFEAILTEVFPFDDGTLDKLFDSPSDKFESELKSASSSHYTSQEKAFGDDVMRKVERDIYLQVLDNLWMQHLESMDHLRQGIHWMSVGQRDPLVEYRRQSTRIFDEFQNNLRHDVVRSIMHAQPLNEQELTQAVETELTRAARGSVDNAAQVTTAEEFKETDFTPETDELVMESRSRAARRKSRKAERQRKKKARKKKK
ncbi:preprotein translocase subunit SecA [Candidatus Saccharibacteria bacterium RIFCSPHIGHO2_01_FULL_49_21]|nr:MAG: preprotein translocase subunit SecA [Candidatus Saccharibacteria bacterium RIFCSPHIGHO2_01_FULL_49_21]